MSYTKTINDYIKIYPEFVSFINGEYNKLDDAEYSKLFFKEIYRLNWYEDIILDIISMHVFKPKFEEIFIERLISNGIWSNKNVGVVKQAVVNGFVNKDFYKNIFRAVIAKDAAEYAAMFYNIDGFKEYNDIIVSKCICNSEVDKLINIIDETSTDIEMKRMAVDKIAASRGFYISKAIDSILAMKDIKQRTDIMNSSVYKLVNKDTIEHFCYMTSFYDVVLPHDVATKIHNSCGTEYFNNNTRRFEKIKRYCYTFGSCLTDSECELFAKRLQTRTRQQYINKALSRVNFTDEQHNALKSYTLLYDLSN